MRTPAIWIESRVSRFAISVRTSATSARWLDQLGVTLEDDERLSRGDDQRVERLVGPDLCRWRPPGRRRRPRPGRAPRPPASARRPAPADVFERQCPEPVTAVREPVKACAGDHPVASILVDSPSPAPTPARRLTPAVNAGNI